MGKRSKNAAAFDEIIQKYERSPAECTDNSRHRIISNEQSICYNHILGICPRTELRQNYKKPCIFYHVPLEEKEPSVFLDIFNDFPQRVKYFQNKSHLIHCMNKLKDEIKEILSSLIAVKHQPPPEVLEYNTLNEEYSIFIINGYKKMAAYTKTQLRLLEDKNAKAGVSMIRCKECPQSLPWVESEREKHYTGRVHLAYHRMQQYIQKYYSKQNSII
ncbi:uncharacterized protein NEPG_01738 [Nematocida parisii ERTm1]|uniref:Uncharacterized protein n=1 Tax=Nematocida parisii (strain ERTm3) TaxID=935791 RepID=I3EIK2_NEMP3|nr:uncharacterized protein NEPG_01738 [Nematocida parisii ERTm1]EIJ89049.1 hypothetical protein NEQG_00868 [Nematocida parisii ERTm3]EIJ93396.1 hypothetical protein NEPG_01738 [Nematocida parisii ERTm1]KAI5144413.1 hypothetical protein NEPAR07_1071 [Nematocida parisii]|eukprot:XP_013059566.1 hypothetical protein NEPG_01738 [Nematocida parisii ERTm1]